MLDRGPATLLKRESNIGAFLSCEYCEIFKDSFFYRTPVVAASVWSTGTFVLFGPLAPLVQPWSNHFPRIDCTVKALKRFFSKFQRCQWPIAYCKHDGTNIVPCSKWNHDQPPMQSIFGDVPAGIYLLKVNNRNTRTRCEICSKLTIKMIKRRYSGVDLENGLRGLVPPPKIL